MESHRVSWSPNVMMRGSLNNWRLLLAVMIGVLLSCAMLAGTVIFYDALQELALRKAIDDMPDEQTDVLLQTDMTPSHSSGYLKLKDSVYEGHISLVNKYLGDVIEGGKSATFFLTDHGYEHLAGKNDARSFIVFMEDFNSKITNLSEYVSPNTNFDGLNVSRNRIHVTVLDEHASTLDLELGDVMSLVPYWEEPVDHVEVVIGSIVTKKDPIDPYWNMFENVFMVSAGNKSATVPMFVSRDQYFDELTHRFSNLTTTYSWFLDIDPQRINVLNSEELRATLSWIEESLSSTHDRFMMKTGLPKTLDYYGDRLKFTKTQMSVVMVLVASVILFYVVSLSSLAVENREFEISKLFSRGASPHQIMMGFGFEALILSGVGFVFGPLLIAGLISLLGLTPVLSSVTGGSLLDANLSIDSFVLSGLAALLCFSGMLIPAYKASRKSVFMQRVQSARRTGKSFVTRYYLDVLLLITGLFLFRQLGERGSFNITGQFGDTVNNNLFLLAPAVVLLGSAIVLLRLFPLVISVLARFLGSVLPISLVMSIWQISRNPGNYGRLALLMILMTSLGVFASIFGGTLDRSFTERIMYSTGSDIRLESVSVNAIGMSKPVMSKYADIAGVEVASPVLRQRGVDLTEKFSTTSFTVLAIHPDSFKEVGWFRDDFSSSSYKDLLRSIDSDSSQMGILIPSDSTALRVSVKSDRPRSSVAVIGRVKDANGRYITYDFGRLETASWKDYQIILSGDEVKIFGSRRPLRQLQPVFPLTLMSIAVAETNSQRDLLAGSILVDEISVQTSQEETIILQTFDGPECCGTLEATSDSLGDNISYIHDELKSSNMLKFSWTEGSPETARGFYIGALVSPVPVIVSKSFLLTTKYDVGDDITISVAGKRIPVNIAGSFDYFPTLDTVRESQVVVSMDPVFDVANSHTLRGDLTPNEIWLGLSDNIDPISRLNLIEHLNGEDPYPIGGFVDRDEELAISKVDPLVKSGWNGLLFLSFSSVLLLSVIGLVTNAYVSLRNREVEFAVMRTIGLTNRQLLLLVWAEQAIITIIGLILGSWMGQRLTAIVMPFMSSDVYGASILPPFVPEVRWESLLLIYTVVIVFLVLVTVAVTSIVKKMQLSRVLRIGES